MDKIKKIIKQINNSYSYTNLCPRLTQVFTTLINNPPLFREDLLTTNQGYRIILDSGDRIFPPISGTPPLPSSPHANKWAIIPLLPLSLRVQTLIHPLPMTTLTPHIETVTLKIMGTGMNPE